MIEEVYGDNQAVDNKERFAETVCAMRNSLGGRIEYDGQVIYVPPLIWYRKPATHKGRVYRRIDGENIISGTWARSIMASHEFSRDDFPVMRALDNEQVNAFRDAVISRNDSYRHFTPREFLRRTGIYSGKYITFAGALMFSRCIHVRAVLSHKGQVTEASARNIWSAYTDLLPRLTHKLSGKCSALMRESLINALLHSDYNIDTHINITITSDPPRAVIDNPGLIQGDIRNYRLKKIFSLAGITHSHNGVIRLKQDILNFRTSANILLEGMPEVVML